MVNMLTYCKNIQEPILRAPSRRFRITIHGLFEPVKWTNKTETRQPLKQTYVISKPRPVRVRSQNHRITEK